MDPQIWYAIYSTIYGGFIGAFDRLGEVLDSIKLIQFLLLLVFLSCLLSFHVYSNLRSHHFHLQCIWAEEKIMNL